MVNANLSETSTAAGISLKKIRFRVVLLLFLVIAICILDRQILSVLAPVLRDKLHLSSTQYGIIVFCFLAGMTVGQVPIGILMDKLGARKSFVIIICMWSLASLGHAFMTTLVQFCVLRFLLGVAECGAYSGGTKVIAQWFAPEDRAFAGGLFNSGSLAGSIVAPPLTVYLAMHYGWRAAFVVPSAIGLLWIFPWLKTFWTPQTHPLLNGSALWSTQASAVAHQSGRTMLQLLSVPAVWGVILMRAFGAPVTNFYWYWLPEYLQRKRGMSFEMIGMLAWLPFFFGGVGNIGGGWLSRALIRRGMSLGRSRTIVITLSILLASSAVFVPLFPTAWALGLICVASLGINSFASNLIGLLIDLFPEYMLARVAALTGLGDGVMSMITMLLTGIVVDHFSYFPIFLAAGIFPLLSLFSFFTLVRAKSPSPVVSEF